MTAPTATRPLDRIRLFASGDPAYAALLLAAFAAGFSMPLARVALVAAFVLTVRDTARGRRPWRFPATAKAWLVYLLVALVTTACVAATNTDPLIVPGKGLGKLNKLLWFLAIPLVPTLVDSRQRFLHVATAFTLGTGLDAARVLLLNTVGAWIQVTLPFPDDPVPSAAGRRLLAATDACKLTDTLRDWTADHWRARTYNDALAKLGGMATAQRLMTGFVAALALALHARRSAPAKWTKGLRSEEVGGAFAAAVQGKAHRGAVWRSALALWLAAGLVVALKRGPWVSAALVVTPLLVAAWGLRRVVPALLVAVALVLALPAARTRLADLPSELTFNKGGRALMWRHIVPGLRKDHPWGVGFRGLTNYKMRCYTRRVELFQNHVHSNPLQILVELGWQGLAAYLAWMFLGLRQGVRLVAGAPRAPDGRRDRTEAFLRAVPLAMLAALFLNGFVEYNFADGELVILYGLAMGLAAVRLPAS